jgi:hypothetical protein
MPPVIGRLVASEDQAVGLLPLDCLAAALSVPWALVFQGVYQTYTPGLPRGSPCRNSWLNHTEFANWVSPPVCGGGS